MLCVFSLGIRDPQVRVAVFLLGCCAVSFVAFALGLLAAVVLVGVCGLAAWGRTRT